MITYADEQLQHSLEWYRARLGNITGSKCGDLMVKGRGKDEVFGGTAKTYLYQLAGERSMNPIVVDNDIEFEKYLDCVDVTSKAMRWGTEHEAEARARFEEMSGRPVTEVASCKHETIEHFAASPDGVILMGDDNHPCACIEIKCLSQTNFMKYKNEVKDGESLKKVESKYYWQTQAEMMCTNTILTFFVVYNPFQINPIHIVRIEKNEVDCAELTERIELANKFIDDLLHGNDVS